MHYPLTPLTLTFTLTSTLTLGELGDYDAGHSPALAPQYVLPLLPPLLLPFQL